MGSEIAIVGYAVFGFLCLLAFRFFGNASGGDGSSSNVPSAGGYNLENIKGIHERIDPFTLAFKMLFIVFFLLSMMGMGKSVIESYDYCYLTVNQSSEVGSDTLYYYQRECFTNEYNGANQFYESTFWLSIISAGLLFVMFVWEGFIMFKQLIMPWFNRLFRRR